MWIVFITIYLYYMNTMIDSRKIHGGGKTSCAVGIALLSTFFVPLIASAQLQPIIDLLGALKRILGILIPMAFGLAVLFFFYGIAMYVRSAGNPKQASEGKSIMVWGVIAIAVMASIWGLVAFLQGTFLTGYSSNAPVQVPQIQGIQYQ